MRGPPIDQLVFEHMFPKPKTFDPQDFSALLQRSLIPEVRQETHAFYGHLDTQEAKYPGLDYTHPTHRIRLSRWQWHRRLFRAFDALGLTHAEISSLTKWEGTKWAKEKFEAEQGIVIRDTAADDLPDWREPVARPSTQQPARTVRINTLAMPSLDDDDNMDVEESDEELASVGVPLNERLRAQAARREAGDTSVVLDEEWEQWLKNAIDSGELAVLTDRMTAEMLGQSHPSSSVTSNPLSDGMLHRARAGQWSEIPEILQPLLRRTIDNENSIRSGQILISATRSTLQPRSSLLSPVTRRNYSNLRLPAGEPSTSQPGARARGA
ncbi:hypothetical protein BBK36DRAFT_1192037 [Trichoderma citrinoviride]|uniref:Uncharacterized protein n=1 Tax=Trichoderma citrinoviride TaxID=58853 RepID=A0A2T4BHN1_9HYPO|nr:hypothetical protein BBK36DRAFT_1192037 [Trichoderma citrinoviride]PTB68810.1 hypothetical protein BBK36DRAFT_1192037 [Trichoderma citrinoviride]